jgi:hypothetical protein
LALELLHPCKCFVVTKTCLPNRWLTMDFRSVSAIPAFRRHVKIRVHKEGGSVENGKNMVFTEMKDVVAACIEYVTKQWIQVYSWHGIAIENLLFILINLENN